MKSVLMQRFLMAGALLGLLCLPVNGWGAVTPETRDQANTFNGSSITKSFTVNNSCPFIVSVSWVGSASADSGTWNGGAMTVLANLLGGNVSTVVYYLPTPTTGTHNFVVTFSAGTSGGTAFLISTQGCDANTTLRTVYTRTSGNGTGPGTTVVDSVADDLVFHAATVSTNTITFDGSEVSTSTEDDAISAGTRSGGLSTLTAAGASTAVGCTDAATYSEVAFAVGAQVVPACRGGLSLLGVGGC